MSTSLKRLLLSVGLWIAVVALRAAIAPLQLPRRLEDSVFVVAFVSVPLAGAILTIKAALRESREGAHKGQANLAALGAIGLAVASLLSGLLMWSRLVGHAGGLD